jgi:hypothetical protein
MEQKYIVACNWNTYMMPEIILETLKKIYMSKKSPLTKAKEKQRAQTFGQQTKTA